MTRATRNGLALAAACGAAAGLAVAWAPPARADVVDVPAALERSRTVGWPHAPSVREARQVARYTARVVIPGGASGVVSCRARSSRTAGLGPVGCASGSRGTHWTGERFPAPRVYRFTVGVRVWEDGSARVFYPEG